MKSVEAIVLAGGYGRRMGEVAAATQKCLLPYEGQPILYHVLDSLVQAFGSVEIKLAVAYKAEQVKEYLEKNTPKSVTVSYIPHTPGIETWSIYHGMREHIRGDFVGLPGDVIALPVAYVKAVTVFQQGQTDAAMTFSPHVDRADSHGVGKIVDGSVTSFQFPAPKQLDSDDLRDMNIYASNRQFFTLLRSYPFPKRALSLTFVHAVADDRPIGGTIYEGDWHHIGYPEDLDP